MCANAFRRRFVGDFSVRKAGSSTIRPSTSLLNLTDFHNERVGMRFVDGCRRFVGGINVCKAGSSTIRPSTSLLNLVHYY